MLAALLFGSLVAAAPAGAQVFPCQSPTGDCVLTSPTSNIPVGIYDIRPRSLVVTNRAFTITGGGEFKVLAQNITLQPGARFTAPGIADNTNTPLVNEAVPTKVSFDAAGTLDIQSQGNTKSRIDTRNNTRGGDIDLRSVGNLNENGPLIASAPSPGGFGGNIFIRSATGNIVITGDASDGLEANGDSNGTFQGGGGSITVDAPLGSITFSTQLVAKNGDCSGCEVDLNAGQNITSTPQGFIDMRASIIGDSGFVSINAGGNINLAGNIFANGASGDILCGAGGCPDGGAGADVFISATGSVVLSGRMEVEGSGRDEGNDPEEGAIDGDAGSVDVSAGTTITVTGGGIFGRSKGFGEGDEFSFDAIGDITIAAELDHTGQETASDITIFSEAKVKVQARIQTTAPVDPIGKPFALGASIDIEGCQIEIAQGGQVISRGQGGTPSGSITFLASTGMTIAGPITATAENRFEWRTSPPVITATVSPAPVIVQNSGLPCCGVSCPTTTTTTSTTTSTSTSRPTTTSTSTSTTSTSTSRPTTTSTVAGTTSTTSTSTSRPTTTSTSSTTSSSTSTSTSRPTTTSTSSTTSSSTSTSTSLPTTTSTTSSSTTTSSSSSSSSSSSTSSSTSSTTSTTLVIGCPASPTGSCQTGAKILLQVNEKSSGKEKIQIKIDKLVSNTAPAFFGDPVGGTTAYAACIYDEEDDLVATLRVDRAQETCGTKPCWKVLGGVGGFKYSDKALTADGVLQLLLKAGDASKGKAQIKGKRNAAKGQVALPIGVAEALAGDTSATVQIRSSNAGCLTGDITTIKDNSSIFFKGQTP